jgi:pyruvate,water dikinase
MKLWLLIWGVYLLGAFLLPGTMVYETSLSRFDDLFWPLVRALGRPGAVAVIAALMAAATMVMQYLVTDVRRLREAKKRAALLNKEAKRFAADTPRFAALRSAAGSVQGRIMMATMVPLAMLLGPMVMIFMWLPARVETTSPEPGSDVKISLTVEADRTPDITLIPPEGFHIKSTPAPLKPIRKTLEGLLNDPQALAAAVQGKEKAPADPAKDLREYLQQLPPQKMVWDLGADEKTTEGRMVAQVQTAKRVISVPFVLGERYAPAPLEHDGGGIIKNIEVIPTKKPTKVIFLAPVSWLPDFGLWGVYLIVYVPAMLALKFALRLP